MWRKWPVVGKDKQVILIKLIFQPNKKKLLQDKMINYLFGVSCWCKRSKVVSWCKGTVSFQSHHAQSKSRIICKQEEKSIFSTFLTVFTINCKFQRHNAGHGFDWVLWWKQINWNILLLDASISSNVFLCLCPKIKKKLCDRRTVKWLVFWIWLKFMF